MNLILLELFMAKEPIDVDYWCDRISKANIIGNRLDGGNGYARSY